jgi:hypothetical protein
MDNQHRAASVLRDGAADTPQQQTGDLPVAARPQNDQLVVSFLRSA